MALKRCNALTGAGDVEKKSHEDLQLLQRFGGPSQRGMLGQRVLLLLFVIR
jgi:hypothetical protein